DSRQFSIIFRMHGDVVKNIRVRGQIHAFDKVAVARYQLRRDQVIEEDDIKMVSKDITSCTNPVLNKELVLGKEVKRGIYPGQVLEKRWLVRPNLVERGQTITMYISKGSLMISALGVACSDAKKDQVIKVKNIGSQKEVYCKVVSSNKALVEY
ncbi:MAG TPA: flagellar basal body P-ring formation chaperone FlgA, partial [Desulfohalobiaceae bacterium]|nr:flagellar basal body P-ring formation chaperone FlgA [Desulfohalobiaceae bacterium]